ncbi:hypothetical protein ALC57_01110 [Trachymyrmex cornetzi]|uniref:Uncharacterized protein n=1 Tax=Trachymyrmex cornetzi TaxID=471704 RepID=A0A151JQD8_9HYME|nr:hypothetical protein ALC57_01110 [Trachymyrmex cornetzi]
MAYDTLSTVFTPGQIKKLMSSKNKRINWSAEDISSAIANSQLKFGKHDGLHAYGVELLKQDKVLEEMDKFISMYLICELRIEGHNFRFKREYY